jgi:hypothetical protein
MAFAPDAGPVVPSVHAADLRVIDAGADTLVTLTGAAFRNIAGVNEYVSDVALTAADGSSLVLTPDLVDQGSLRVTIPGEIAPGNYDLRAVKQDAAGDDVASNPAVISIKPQVTIEKAAKGADNGTVMIQGSGFGGYAAGSGTSVVGTVARNNKVKTVEAEIVSWSDTQIEADFGGVTVPDDVTVTSVFGVDTAPVLGGNRGRSIRR